ncbi:MAG: hypothetical protein PXX73_07080 [Sideroxydans sp.]|nr:hypothetical protein [Sideroxydans sp.]
MKNNAMRLSVLMVYLSLPALLTIVGSVSGGAVDVAQLMSFFFYAAPHFLWLTVAVFAKFSNALWHAGLIAASVALSAISALWLLPQDPSGLPLQWLLYLPLAIVLQIVAAIFTFIVRAKRLKQEGWKQ